MAESIIKKEEKRGLTPDEVFALVKEPPPSETRDFGFTQTMYRIKDPRKSLPFYTGVLGMRLLNQMHFPEMEFSLYFMGYKSENELVGERGSDERRRFALTTHSTIELTHNWGTESDPQFAGYHSGNEPESRGYGHIGITVPDVEEACARFEQMGVDFVKRPNEGRMKGLAFIKDPDGYWIEILNPGKM